MWITMTLLVGVDLSTAFSDTISNGDMAMQFARRKRSYNFQWVQLLLHRETKPRTFMEYVIISFQF